MPAPAGPLAWQPSNSSYGPLQNCVVVSASGAAVMVVAVVTGVNAPARNRRSVRRSSPASPEIVSSTVAST